jgi:hypothetical protein
VIHIVEPPVHTMAHVAGITNAVAMTGHVHGAGRQRATIAHTAPIGSSHHRKPGSHRNGANRNTAGGGYIEGSSVMEDQPCGCASNGPLNCIGRYMEPVSIQRCANTWKTPKSTPTFPSLAAAP